MLWLLWVPPEARGHGAGRRFVAQLRAAHETSLPMLLLCHGAGRVAWFQGCGFQLEDAAWDGRSAASMIGRLP